MARTWKSGITAGRR
uniref:Uncharacterized protein n=1 Tax=Arundo donax TaxID=35708 RepID=A0A0A9BD34_ARUDO